MMRNFLYFLILAPALLLASSGWADQKDPRLDSLFAQLQVTKSLEQARSLENEIWTIWLASPSDTANLLMQQGISAMQAGALRESYAIFSHLVEQQPDFAEAYNKRATVLFLAGELDASLGDCFRVLQLEPRHFGALSGMGMIYTALEEDEKALLAYENVLRIHPHALQAVEEARKLRRKLKGNPT